jgi:formate hydrogenlyase subunit 3/multisubunit Na+/H+ antiporter MnhD subunit
MAALVLVGVGVKSGVPGLHSWMPAAYSAAPNAAAAALAGGTISVGILGFLRLGVGAQPTGLPSLAWLGIGVAGAIFGVARGLVQREPERILAYSSVSQMGMALAALAFGSLVAAEASAVSVAMAAFLFHHALAKASLFLGVGAVRGGVKVGGRADHPIILAMLSLPALALAGLPFTSGAIAKGALVDAIPTQGLDVLLLAASAGTTALMLHFVVTVRDLSRVEAGRGTPGWGLRGPWFTSVAVAAVGVWLWPDFRVAAAHALRPAAVWHGLPPLVAGGLAWAFARRAGWRGTRRISLGERAAYALAVWWGDWSVRRREVRPRLRHLPADVRRRARHLVSAAEGGVGLLDSRVGTWTLTGTLFIALLLALRMAL